MPALLLACVAYLSVALPGSALGLLWPSIRLSLGQPVGALGILLIPGIAASVISSAVTGRLRLSAGPLVAASTLLITLALAAEALAPSMWVLTVGTVLFGVGFGTLDTALNAHAARHFGARDINWMHASYGLGATLGPLLVTALLSAGRSWRQVYGLMAFVLAVLAVVHALARRRWQPPASAPAPRPAGTPAPPPAASAVAPPAPPVRRPAGALASLNFIAVETGIESGAGVWGYQFLTSGRGLPPAVAGVAVAAYWAMMCVGRVVLGPVAERLGPARVLAAAVVGLPLGAMLMAVPGPGALAVAGLLLLGLAAAPVFPLFTLTTGTTRMVSLQVAASAVGGAAIPAGLGLLLGAAGPGLLAPALLALGLAVAGLYAFIRPG
ncbi:MAG TPA: MFS transporter [Streptosporangiaceae bacterium]|nr:MFS transporter [Streptosporangiaceae bacterium]